jgi:hypothetical protein
MVDGELVIGLLYLLYMFVNDLLYCVDFATVYLLLTLV